MRRGDLNYAITPWATFKNKKLEKQYFSYDIFKSLTFTRQIVLICGLVFFSICIYDVVYYEFDHTRYIYSLASRSAGLFVAVAFYLLAPKIKNARAITFFLSFFELAIILGYLFIVYSQREQGFPEQAMTIMLMNFCIYMLPNRWSNLLVTSGFSIGALMFLAPYYIVDLQDTQRIELSIVMVAAVMVASLFYYKENDSKRKQYAEYCMRTQMSYTDRLTKIYNRSRFDEELARRCRIAQSEKDSFCIILMDIDHFKAVNDTYGHLVGDQVLVDIAISIRRSIRADDIFARWGGEEFVILQRSSELAVAAELADRLRQQIAEKEFETVGRVTLSMGVVAFQPGDAPITIMQRVDQALYYSKETGRNRVTAV